MDIAYYQLKPYEAAAVAAVAAVAVAAAAAAVAVAAVATVADGDIYNPTIFITITCILGMGILN